LGVRGDGSGAPALSGLNAFSKGHGARDTRHVGKAQPVGLNILESMPYRYQSARPKRWAVQTDGSRPSAEYIELS
jgi:hypothetical protein